jgi:uncharacterized membrane protein YfcA
MALAETALVLVVALAASILSFFSGFGLGTLLLPAFALVFPLDVAVAATAVVHLGNNLWKGVLAGRGFDGSVVLRFGVPATLAALAGAGLLLLLEGRPLATYRLGGEHQVTALGLAIGATIVAFALLELVPRFRRWSVGRRWLPLGGSLSGFFGGLSGHQGALRSAFLVRVLPDARTLVATGVVCAILVDVARLAVYGTRYASGVAALDGAGWMLLAAATGMALVGAVVGAMWLPKVTVEGIRVAVGLLLLAIGPLIAAGLL